VERMRQGGRGREDGVEGKRRKDEAVKQRQGARGREGGRKGRGHCGDEASNMSDLTWARSHSHNVPHQEKEQCQTVAAAETAHLTKLSPCNQTPTSHPLK